MKTSFVNLSLVILCMATGFLVTGIPIDISNNGKRYAQPQPPPLQQQQPHIRPHPNHYHQPQQSIPPTEETGPLHTNQNQFRRHSITPPDIKMTSGNFQNNPAESFERGNSGSSFYHREESHQPCSNHFRHQHQHQPPPSINPEASEAQDTRQGPNAPYRQNFQHPASSQGPPQHPRAPNLHPEENHINQAAELFESNRHKNTLKENGRPPNSKIYQDEPKYSKTFPYPMHHEQRFHEKASPNPMPPPPSAPTVSFIVPDSDGKLLIEYDISENDVTSETTVEVEDGAENNVESNDI